MDQAKWQMPHKRDMYVSDAKQRWLRTEKLEKEDGSVNLAILLEKCEVDDVDRLGFWEGQWYKVAK